MIHHQVQKLFNLPQPVQKSKEWFEIRKNKITASEIASVLTNSYKLCKYYVKEFDIKNFKYNNDKCCNPYCSYKNFLMKKCGIGEKFSGNIFTYWGQRFEPIVQKLYSHMNDKNVYEFGFIIHEKYSYLGASPDGITSDGIMIEIKCPYKREINGIIPLYYWKQIQLQLEVCNLEVCDYIECNFEEYSNEKEFLKCNDSDIKYSGIFIEIRSLKDNIFSGNSSYIYPDKILLTKQEYINWATDYIMKNNDKIDNKKYVYVQIYWKLLKYSCITVKRSKKWFRHANIIFKKVMKDIRYHKKNNGKELLFPKQNKDEEKEIILDIQYNKKNGSGSNSPLKEFVIEF
jgi:putative phage-type endonuclease